MILTKSRLASRCRFVLRRDQFSGRSPSLFTRVRWAAVSVWDCERLCHYCTRATCYHAWPCFWLVGATASRVMDAWFDVGSDRPGYRRVRVRPTSVLARTRVAWEGVRVCIMCMGVWCVCVGGTLGQARYPGALCRSPPMIIYIWVRTESRVTTPIPWRKISWYWPRTIIGHKNIKIEQIGQFYVGLLVAIVVTNKQLHN